MNKLERKIINHFKKEGCTIIKPKKVFWGTKKEYEEFINFPDFWVFTDNILSDKRNHMGWQHAFIVKMTDKLTVSDATDSICINYLLAVPLKLAFKRNGELILTHNCDWVNYIIDNKFRRRIKRWLKKRNIKIGRKK